MLLAVVVAAMSSPQMRKPRPTGDRDTAQRKNSNATLSHHFREAVATIAIGAMLGVMFWQSVFGMVDDFTSGPAISFFVAEVDDGR